MPVAIKHAYKSKKARLISRLYHVSLIEPKRDFISPKLYTHSVLRNSILFFSKHMSLNVIYLSIFNT